MADFSLETEYGDPACGIDEVGRGPLAGPVIAACVYIPPEKRELDFIALIKDSKKLSRARLEYCETHIKAHCLWGIGECSVEEIDRLNILQASLLAMERAFSAMPQPSGPGLKALVDGNRAPKNLPCPVYTIVKGDNRSKSIAAAAILAKTHRDSLMEDLHRRHPHYGWDANVGYPTLHHRTAIQEHGITPHHRKTFAPVRAYIERKIA